MKPNVASPHSLWLTTDLPASPNAGLPNRGRKPGEFDGTDLAAFSNLNNTNFGADYPSGRWSHTIRFSFVHFNNFIVDADSAAGTANT